MQRSGEPERRDELGVERGLVESVEEVLKLALVPPLETKTHSGARSLPKPFPPKPRAKPVVV